MTRLRIPGRQIRFLVYLLVVAGLFLARGQVRWRELFPGFHPGAGDTLVVAGRDLAPVLIDRLVALYRSDYPELTVLVRGGGTNHALEDLINREADVAFLVRPPSAEEQRLFTSVDGDTALWFPIALGGVALLEGGEADPDPVGEAGLRPLLEDGDTSRFSRVYVPDPNWGLWDAFREALGVSAAMQPATVVFLADETEIPGAVQADPGAVGVVSTLALPGPLPAGVVAVRVGETADAAVPPTFENIAHGEYPLVHALYASCRGHGDIQGTKFVTLLTSAPGQRRVENAGFVPALLYRREVVLTTDPMGD